jgi:diketogulonate reductase-like aldo/keto reductase
MDPNTNVTLRSGREMPVLGLGTWQLTRDTAGTIGHALAVGYRMIDTSGDYGTQPGIGEGMRRSDVPREQVYLVTKVEEHEDAYESTRRSLDELALEHADMVLIHRPPPRGVGEDLWRGLIRARQDGLTVDIGVSNYSIEQIARLIDATGETPAVNQVEWTPFGWQPEMLDYCRERKIVLQAYSPLTRATRLDDETLREVAGRYRKSPAQVLIRWNLQRGTVPLPKANRHDHLAEDLDVFDFAIDDAEMARLDGLNRLSSALGERVRYA